jgi:MYXO-CTERM domain-containing protein
LAYATAGATSAFAAAHSAEATIHYSGQINLKFSFGYLAATFPLDQRSDFIRVTHFTATDYFGYGYVSVVAGAGAAVVGFLNDKCDRGQPFLSNVESGQFISSQRFRPAHRGVLFAGSCKGQFNQPGIGYIGFKFNNGNGDQYGWIRIQTHGNIHHNFILRDYAYGDVDDRVKAGQTSSDDMATDKGSLGLLALGAAGLLAWRQRRSKARAQEL